MSDHVPHYIVAAKIAGRKAKYEHRIQDHLFAEGYDPEDPEWDEAISCATKEYHKTKNRRIMNLRQKRYG